MSKVDQIRALREARAARSKSPASPRVAGMPRGKVNAGGGHEVTPQSSVDREKARDKVHDAYLTVPKHIVKDRRTGTAPGVCGPEREMVGAPNPKKRSAPGTFDRKAYQREYMRKRRAKAKEGGR